MSFAAGDPANAATIIWQPRPSLNLILDSQSYMVASPATTIGPFSLARLVAGQQDAIQKLAAGAPRSCCSGRTQQFGDGGTPPATSVRN